MTCVLHITPHMGGGVGRFLSQTTIYEKKINSIYQHKILLLERPEKAQFINYCYKQGIDIEVSINEEYVANSIKSADIVVLHWWHNPTMCKLLANFPNYEVRLVLWSHVSGCNYPAFTAELADIPHMIFFTSPYSYENPLWRGEELHKIRLKSRVIYGLGLEENSEIKVHNYLKAVDKQGQDEFNIIYTGTLSKSKIHPQFINYCKEVVNRIPCTRFVMLGDLEGSQELIKEAKINHIEDHFVFVGYTNEVEKYLQESDVFGYPLNPFHFGTTENAVIEAMAEGLPVVMINQCTEKYIVEHEYDGLLAKNEQEYAQYMEFLYENPHEKIRLGQNAQNTILNKYSLKHNIARMHEQFESLMQQERIRCSFQPILGEKPIDWFLSCLGENKELFENILVDRGNPDLLLCIKECQPILRGKNKSSAIHFAQAFPEDKDLEFLKQIILR